jgi:hypothetical protein
MAQKEASPKDKAYNAVKTRLDPLLKAGVNVSPMRIGTREHGAEWSQKFVMVELADLELLFKEAMQARGSQPKKSESRASSDRFFPATILAGRLHVRGVPPWGPWDAARLEYQTEKEIDTVLNETIGDRKVRTAAELHAVLKAPPVSTFSPTVWIHESLEGEVQTVWEASPRGQR